MREWIDRRLKEIGETKSGLGRHLDLPFARISEMISGKRDIKASEVTPIADYLKLTPSGVLQLIEDPNIGFDEAEQSSHTPKNRNLHIDPDILYDVILRLNQELVKQKKKMNASERSFAIALGYEEKHRKINGLPPLRPEEIAMLIKRPDKEDILNEEADFSL